MKYLWYLFLPPILWANPLQEAIDNARPNSVIELGDGIYEGNITIDKPIGIVGGKNAKAIIKNCGTGSVITIESSNVFLQNLVIKSSGHRKEMLDSGIKGEKIDNITIKNCRIEDVLYGINISLAKNLDISSNYISSKDEKRPLRGDAIKLWYAQNVIIRDNTVKKARDVHIDRSKNITLAGNRFLFNRFALHLEYSDKILVQNNFFQYNDAGILTENAKHIEIINNKILSGKGSARIGVVLKGGEDILVKKNIVKYNSKGVYVDAKPSKKAKTKREILSNEISFNLEGIHFHTIIANNVIKYNKIHDNLDDVVKDLIGYGNINNTVEYNYWGKYRGFDRNHDNIGDTPYIIKRYMGKLWNYNNKIKFFYGSAVLAWADFLCEIAPFSEPELILEDKKPILKAPPKPLEAP